MSQARGEIRFIRRTVLGVNERRVNFRQIDWDVIEALTSREATSVTPLMSKVYLRLLSAPLNFWEGVLRFGGAEVGGRWQTAWEQMFMFTRVSKSTLSKALTFLHQIGVIGYDARKNGFGVCVFINRAASSIRCDGAQKNYAQFILRPAMPLLHRTEHPLRKIFPREF
jgi:hypothetical protein